MPCSSAVVPSPFCKIKYHRSDLFKVEAQKQTGALLLLFNVAVCKSAPRRKGGQSCSASETAPKLGTAHSLSSAALWVGWSCPAKHQN